jgi:hypothetical protein
METNMLNQQESRDIQRREAKHSKDNKSPAEALGVPRDEPHDVSHAYGDDSLRTPSKAYERKNSSSAFRLGDSASEAVSANPEVKLGRLSKMSDKLAEHKDAKESETKPAPADQANKNKDFQLAAEDEIRKLNALLNPGKNS